jgi:uncharacterized protein YndB with AHSA1/START domain
MSENYQMQIALKAAPDAILRAWTDELAAWFAEYADVSIPEKRFHFWGRFTPENPDREAGRHPLLAYEPGKSFSFGWHLDHKDRTFEISLHPKDGHQILVMRQEEHTAEDFWFLSLENLRRHLDGKLPVRCDYAQPMLGDIHQSVEIDAPRSAVYEALIRPEQLERWIASKGAVEPVVGGTYDIGWNYGVLKILELVPDEKLAVEWTEGETTTVLSWTLEESDGRTRLTLVHSGFAPDKPSGLNTGWINYMSWIKSIVEYGPDWQPAISRINPAMAAIYPAVITRGQADLIPEKA